MIRLLKRLYFQWRAREADRAAEVHGKAMAVAMIRMDWDAMDRFGKEASKAASERLMWLRKVRSVS